MGELPCFIQNILQTETISTIKISKPSQTKDRTSDFRGSFLTFSKTEKWHERSLIFLFNDSNCCSELDKIARNGKVWVRITSKKARIIAPFQCKAAYANLRSNCMRYCTISSMVRTGMLCSLPNATISGVLAIVPSGLVTSHRTPDGIRPAICIKSTVPSV